MRAHTIFIVLAVAVVALCKYAFIASRFSIPDPSIELLSMPLSPNSLLNVDVPLSQLASTKVGDEVQGQVQGSKGTVFWKGAITSGVKISPTQGAVTVRIISDKYIAPGTPVSGSVGKAAFVGTVVGSPNHQQRMGNIERRLSALEPERKEEVLVLQARLKKLKKHLSDIEGHKTIAERMENLENEIVDLEKAPPPSEDSATFSGNIAGIHFVGGITPVGQTGLSQRLDLIDARISKMEERKPVQEFLKPVQERLQNLEAKVDEISKPGGAFHSKKELLSLEKQLAELERRYGKDFSTNSKWYGTQKYHGLEKSESEPLDADNAPAGSF